MKEAGITIVIITGDNPLTGANIGFKSGVIDKEKSAMIIDILPNGRIAVENFHEQDDTENQETQGTSEHAIVFNKQKPDMAPNFECSVGELPQRAINIAQSTGGVYIMTGSAFTAVFNDDLTDEKKEFIKHIKVFARAKPN